MQPMHGNSRFVIVNCSRETLWKRCIHYRNVPGQSDIRTTDLNGEITLIDAAVAAKVRQFVYTSFSGNLDLDFPLRNAKRAVEQHLQRSGLTYTILRPSFFMEVWLSPAVGFDAAGPPEKQLAESVQAVEDRRQQSVTVHAGRVVLQVLDAIAKGAGRVNRCAWASLGSAGVATISAMRLGSVAHSTPGASNGSRTGQPRSAMLAYTAARRSSPPRSA